MKLKLALLTGLMFAVTHAAESGAYNDNLGGNDFLRIIFEQMGAITDSGSRYEDAMRKRNKRIAAEDSAAGIAEDSFTPDQSNTPLELTRESSIKRN